MVLVTGSRTWANEAWLQLHLEFIRPSRLLQGVAVGADWLARKWAINHNVPVEDYVPNWGKYGRRAGLERNTVMVREIQILNETGFDAFVLAFWDGSSTGTRDCITKALEANLLVYLVTEEYLSGQWLESSQDFPLTSKPFDAMFGA